MPIVLVTDKYIIIMFQQDLTSLQSAAIISTTPLLASHRRHNVSSRFSSAMLMDYQEVI